jgi:hypothetical protein
MPREARLEYRGSEIVYPTLVTKNTNLHVLKQRHTFLESVGMDSRSGTEILVNLKTT